MSESKESESKQPEQAEALDPRVAALEFRVRRLEALADEKFEIVSDSLLSMSANIAVLQRVEHDRERGCLRKGFSRTFELGSEKSEYWEGIDFEGYMIEYLLCTQVLPFLASLAKPIGGTV